MVSAIVAVDNNWGIGFNGELLEKIPEDMKHFKELVTLKAVIVGRKTWESIPKTLDLLTRNVYYVISNKYQQPFYTPPDEYVIYTHLKDIPDVIDANENIYHDDVVIIGGGQIYKELLPYCDRVYVTKIYKSHENVDTYFPNLDESDEWAPAFSGTPQTHGDITYQFWEYDRIS